VDLGNPNYEVANRMLPTFVIGLREGVEAALIVGIIASFLRREGRSDALRPMWLGVFAAIGICVLVGVGLELLDEELPQRQQEGLETVVGILAVGIVTFMVVWMRRHARDLSGQLRRSAGAALAAGSTAALVAMAFFAVFREGLETVVFLLAVFQNAEDPLSAGAGALLGLAAAVGIGALIYRGGIKLNLARFFRVTGVVLVFVAAGLVASAIHTAHEAGWLNAGQGQAMDLTWLVVPGTWTSALLTGMLGWQPQPTYAEVIGYVLYLVPAALYVLWPARAARPVRARMARAAGTTTLLALIVLALAACGSSSGGSDKAGSGAKQVELKLTDAGCSPATLKLPAGRTTFKVTNAGTGRVSEMEVLSGARILGEKENLVAGLSGTFTITLQPGQYTLSCPGGTTAATGVVTVGGKPVAGTTDPRLQAAATGYREYVSTQAQLLVRRVRPFVAAVKAGDVASAKRRFAAARAPYETIEPVAESFGNLDPEIDARVNDVKKGDRWTGFHRIEQALWQHNTTKGMGPIADKLLRDCLTLERKTRTLSYQPDELANGANGLLDEVASSKISGEEDRYSHTDLSDFLANVSGSQTTFGLLAPALRSKNPELASSIGRRFDAVQQELATLRKGDSFPAYDTIGGAERKQLSQLVEDLAKPVKGISDALGD
jgi:FTR1 family protein